MVAPPVSLPTAPVSRPDKASRPGPLVTATVAILVAATVIPLGYVAWAAVSIGWTKAYDLVVRPRVGDLLFNTVALVVVAVPLCVVIGVGAAWLVERTDLPGRTFWRPLFVAPLAIPAFVNSYAWVGVIPSLHGLWAGVLVSTLSYFPFSYLPVAATLRRLDPAVEESARALGSDSAAVFVRVVLPQLRLAILGGGLLIGVHLLAEFGAFAMVRFDTFTVAIFQQFQVTFDGAAGSMLAGVLVLLCLVLLVAEALARGSVRFARIGAGAPRAATPIHLGRNVIPAQFGLVVLTVLTLGVPVWTILRWLWIGGADVWVLDDIGTALGQTIGLATVAAVLTTVLAFPIAWVAVRSSGVLARTVEGANYITSSLPGIVTALALITVTIQIARPLYQSVALIVFAYVLLFMPRALVNV
ncbi:MAG: iron(III) transport system permease protein, partial [Mycobacterium sp.]|nr:iron(III) transport system permease protein [Mycobacterium sp.]